MHGHSGKKIRTTQKADESPDDRQKSARMAIVSGSMFSPTDRGGDMKFAGKAS
jgi:hypothetical protein